jgi:hypothetical protein
MRVTRPQVKEKFTVKKAGKPNLKEHQQMQDKDRREARKEGNRAQASVAKYAPIAVKRAFVEENYDTALAKLKAAVAGDGYPACPVCKRDGEAQPWALRAWLEAAGAIGTMQQVTINLHQSLGVGSDEELVRLVESGRQMERMSENVLATLDQLRDEGVEVLLTVIRARPEWRRGIVTRLGGTIEEAEEVEP